MKYANNRMYSQSIYFIKSYFIKPYFTNGYVNTIVGSIGTHACIVFTIVGSIGTHVFTNVNTSRMYWHACIGTHV